MKKLLLVSSLLFTSNLLVGQGSVVVQVLTPSSIANAYNNVFAVAASAWGVADLTLPANSVLDTLQLVSDGTSADSLCCEALVNGGDVEGKIAVIYRGSCPFSQKALNAQNAGAIAVLLISNGDDLAINMQGGTLGTLVTIPVTMISQSSGAIIRPVLDAEDVTAFIGNNFGQFANNLNVDGEDVLVPRFAGVPSLVATTAAEFQVDLGGFIHNFGSEQQTTARLRAIVTQNGNELYNEVSADQSIAPGDSVFVQLDPAFTQNGYTDSYSITYVVESDPVEEFAPDNSYTFPLSFGELATYVPVDAALGVPISEAFVSPAEPTGAYRTCMHYTDPNGSRLSVRGLYFAAATATDLVDPQDSVLTDNLVSTFALLWTDPVDAANTLPTDGGTTTLSNGEYIYTSNLQRESVYIPFQDPIILEDGVRYLFCAETSEPLMRHGWNEKIDYTTNGGAFGVNNEPTTMLRDGVTWFNGFTGLSGAPSLGIRAVDLFNGVEQTVSTENIIPFPNPTKDFLSIPLRGSNGSATLQVFDVNGAKVAEQQVLVSGNLLQVDVQNISAGTYLFHMEFESGKRSDFRVVVAK